MTVVCKLRISLNLLGCIMGMTYNHSYTSIGEMPFFRTESYQNKRLGQAKAHWYGGTGVRAVGRSPVQATALLEGQCLLS